MITGVVCKQRNQDGLICKYLRTFFSASIQKARNGKHFWKYWVWQHRYIFHTFLRRISFANYNYIFSPLFFLSRITHFFYCWNTAGIIIYSFVNFFIHHPHSGRLYQEEICVASEKGPNDFTAADISIIWPGSNKKRLVPGRKKIYADISFIFHFSLSIPQHHQFWGRLLFLCFLSLPRSVPLF